MKTAGTVAMTVGVLLTVPASPAEAETSSRLGPVDVGMTDRDCRSIAQFVGSRPALQRVVRRACEQHVQKRQLQWCGSLRWGPRKEWWRVRNACRIRVLWPSENLNDRRAAVRVAWCEGSFAPNAKNGQYWGTFQMGSDERETYGHGNTIAEQVEAAADYWEVSGWNPWQCYPGSIDEREAWQNRTKVNPYIRRFG